VWTYPRLQLGYRAGQVYVKGAHKKEHPPKLCRTGWTIRDGRIAECLQPFTRGRTDKEYHSTKCLFQTRRWRELGYHLGDSVRRTCAYRNCRKSEGGTRKSFDRVKRSPTGEYYCPGSTHAQREREAREIDRVRTAAKAEALAQAGANGQGQAQPDSRKRGKYKKKSLKEKRPFQIGLGVERENANFEQLYAAKKALPSKSKRNDKALKRELSKAGFSDERINVALRSQTPLIAARRYISNETGMSLQVVGKYHREYKRTKNASLDQNSNMVGPSPDHTMKSSQTRA
jgi:hypothetical protein